MKLPIFKMFKFILIGILLTGILLEIRNLKDASSSMLKIGIVDAQVPPPNSTCTPSDLEFHSLRPYQASPCQTTIAPLAKFCGNTLTLQDTIDVTYRPGIDNCTPLSNGTVRCSYIQPVSETITIDLSNVDIPAKFPILGNTENVPNSQTPPPSSLPLTDAEKVNGYVSWYLNGVLNRAEEGSSNKNTDINTIINFSGPLNKLLPSVIQDAQRIKTIDNVAAGQNHNQNVACVNSNIPIIGNVLKIGAFTPIDCYSANGSGAKGVVLKLNSWNGSLSLFNTAINGVTGIVDKIVSILPSTTISRALIEQYVTQAWNKKTPPLPWSDQNGVPFANEDLYLKAYNEWRGKSCVIIPLINKVVCFENVFVPNIYADMYTYIPYSSTEDVAGSVQIDSVSVGGPGITNVTFTKQSSPLFFPHLVESDQLGSTLQDTYISKDQQKDQKTGADTAVEPSSSCTTVDVRSNAGDKLFATQLTGNLGYTASFTCIFTPQTCGTQSKSGKEICTGTTQTCSKTINIALSTLTSIPKIDDIWSRLVAGPTAIVKRMFPKLGTQIGTLKDLPGSTAITYSGANASSGQLNFPHVGGISEYFLNGIQTLLRPKGFGQPISFGKISVNPTEVIDCDKSAPNITLPNTIGKQALHDLAIRLEGGVTGDQVLECYNDVARKSLAAGISPAFTFLMWINESGGSNYTLSNQDWGVNSSQIAGFNAQLAKFLQLPAIYKSTYSECFGKTRTDTETFFDLFAVGLQGGLCVPEAGQPYIKLFDSFWNIYTSCPFSVYPFSSSCY